MKARWIIHIAITVALVVLVEIVVGWGPLLKTWETVDPLSGAGAVGLLLASYALRAARLVDFFEEISLRRSPACLQVSVIHNFYNNLLPMRTGEVSFPILMNRAFGIDVRTSIATLLWFRLLDLLAVALMGAAVLALIFHLWPVAVVIVAAALVMPLWLATALRRTLDLIGRLRPAWADHLDIARKGWPDRAATTWRFWAWTVLNWIVKLWAFVIVFRWFIDIDPSRALLAVIGAEVTSVLPIHSVAGLGTYESGAVVALTLLGEPGKYALTAAINLHLWIIGITFVTGLIAFALGAPRSNVTRDRPDG